MSSFVTYDRLGVAVAQTNMMWSTYRRIDAVWPKTTTVYLGQTYEVFAERLEYYHQDDGLKIYSTEFQKFMSISGMSNSDFESVDYDDAEIEYAFFYLNEPGTEYDTVAPDPGRAIPNTDVPKIVNAIGKPQDRVDYTPEQAFAAMSRGGADHRILGGKVFTVDIEYGGLLGGLIPEDNFVNLHTTFDPNANPMLDPVMTVTPAMSMVAVRDKLMEDIGSHLLGIAPKINSNSRRFGVFINDKLVNEKSGSDMKIESLSTPAEFDRYHAKPTINMSSSEKYGFYALFDYGHTTFRVRTISEPVAIPFDPNMNAQKQYGFRFTVEYEAINNLDDTSDCMPVFLNDFNTMNKNGNAWKVALAYIITARDFFWENPEYPSDTLNQHDDGSIWVNGLLTTQSAYEMKKHDFMKMMGDKEAMGQDFKVEDPTFWEKLFAVCVIAIGVIISVYTCGTIRAGKWFTKIFIYARAFTLATAAMTMGSVALAYFGGPSAYGLSKQISKVAQMTGIAAAALSITGLFQSAWKVFTAADPVKNSVEAKAQSAVNGNIAVTEAFTPNEMKTKEVTEAINAAVYEAEFKQKLAENFIPASTRIYAYYDMNFGEFSDTMNEAQASYEELQEMYELNKANAPKNQMILGSAQFTHSMGSYDAIAELNVKVDQSIGPTPLAAPAGSELT